MIDEKNLTGFEIRFLTNFERLKSFVEQKHRRPTKDDDIRVYNFYNRMKKDHKTGKLLPERYEMLLPYVEFRDERELIWQDNYILAKKFYEKEGHLRPPIDSELDGWIKSQRQMYARDIYQDHRKRLLDDIGMIWNVFEDCFYSSLEKLKALGYIPTKKENKEIREWADEIKIDYKSGRLSEEKLNAVYPVLGKFLDFKKTKMVIAPDTRALVMKMHRQGSSKEDILKATGITVSILTRILNREGISPGRAKPGVRTKVIELYQDGETLNSICAQTGIKSDKTIYSILRYAGVELRKTKNKTAE